MADPARKPKLLYVVTEDWYFCSHRLPLAIAAKDAGFDVAVATRVCDHGKLIEDAGLKLIPFEISRRGMNPLRELPTIVRLAAFYHREKPDLVHHVAMKPVLYGSIAAHLVGVRHVVNAVAGLGWLYTSRRLTTRMVRFVMQQVLARALRASEIIVQNPDDRNQLRAVGLDRLHLIHGAGVDTRVFAPVQRPLGQPCVVLASRMLWNKGVGEFVAAARALKMDGISARFVLVGGHDPGNPAAIPEEQLRAWRAEGVVEWWGHRSDMAEVLAQAHIACLPSYREGLPKSLVEAAACGLPIVTTDAPGCREVVEDGVNGFLVPVKDSSALAEALRKLIADAGLRQRMGTASRAKVLAEFSQEKVIDQTLALYHELISEGAGP